MNLSTPTPQRALRYAQTNEIYARLVWGSRFLLLLVSFLFFGIGFNADFILADESFKVVINEIAWMGTKESYNDEWIELYNNSDSSVNLDGWTLKADDGSPEIKLSGFILSKSFYLLERTDDDSVTEISADIIYTGALNNKGEILELFDANENLIDKKDCSDGWFAGDNKTKQTMERKNPEFSGNDPENWQTSQETNGTPKKQNSKAPAIHIGYEQQETAGGEVKSQPFQSQQPQEITTYPGGIVVNEILPSPEGPDAENEWLEIFNENSIEVDISDWKISDTVGSVKSYTFPKGTKISGKGFLLLNRTETKITLNNNGDGLKIFNPNGEIADEINFGKAALGQSYNKFNSQWQWSENLTPCSVNIADEIKEKTEKTEETLSLLSENLKSPASLSEALQGKAEYNRDKFSPIIIALIIAVCSGITILILKKKLKTD